MLIALLSANGCAWLDKGEHVKIVGDYEVGWDDLESNRSIKTLNRKCGDGCYDVVVDSYVYSVGHNNLFIFVKQHPNLDKTKTKYFLIDVAKNSKDVQKGIFGPLDKDQFEKRLKEFRIANAEFDLDFSNSPWTNE